MENKDFRIEATDIINGNLFTNTSEAIVWEDKLNLSKRRSMRVSILTANLEDGNVNDAIKDLEEQFALVMDDLVREGLAVDKVQNLASEDMLVIMIYYYELIEVEDRK